MKINLKKIISTGFILGLLLLIIQITLGMDEKVFLKVYIVFTIIIISGIVIFLYLVQRDFIDRLNSLNYLFDNNRYDEYLKRLSLLEKNTNRSFNKNLIRMNKSVALDKMGRSSEAYLISKNHIDIRLLEPINRLIYYSNIIEYAYNSGDKELAYKEFKENEEYILRKLDRQDKNTKLYIGIIGVLSKIDIYI